jgi:hypothetical protein
MVCEGKLCMLVQCLCFLSQQILWPRDARQKPWLRLAHGRMKLHLHIWLPLKMSSLVSPCLDISVYGFLWSRNEQHGITSHLIFVFLVSYFSTIMAVLEIRPRPFPSTSVRIHNFITLILDAVTCYGRDGPRIESRWGRDFSHPSKRVLGPTQPPVQCVRGLFPGSKAAGVWR